MTLYFSVVICTYNRADLLATALDSVCTQTLEASAYEVIVVDNNSGDDTPAVTDSFCQRYANVRYLFEPQPGNSHARNSGWKAANGKYVAFIDDDCKVPPDWLANAYDSAEKISLDIFGGPYYAYYRTPKPSWFQDSYGSYSLYDQATMLAQPGELAAGNLFVKRDVLKKTDGFNPQFGIIGQKRGYGEESELLKRIRESCPDLTAYYDPDLFVYHLVRAETMTWRWICHARFVQGYDFARLSSPPKSMLHFLGRLVKYGALFLLGVTFGVLLRNREKYLHAANYFYEVIADYIHVFGHLYGQLCRQLRHGQRGDKCTVIKVC